MLAEFWNKGVKVVVLDYNPENHLALVDLYDYENEKLGQATMLEETIPVDIRVKLPGYKGPKADGGDEAQGKLPWWKRAFKKLGL